MPINVGDITTFIPYVPSSGLTAPNNVQITESNGESVISWGNVEHASQYDIQALNSSGVWVSILITDALSVVLDGVLSWVIYGKNQP